MMNNIVAGRARIADILGVSERTVSRLRRQGKLPCQQIGGRSSPLRIAEKKLKKILKGKSR